MGNLNLPTIAENQDDKEATSNEADEKLEKALTEVLTVDLSSGNATLTDAQFRENVRFLTSGNAVSRDLTVPAIERGFFIVSNGGSATLNVVRGSTTVTISANNSSLLATDGTTDGLSELGIEPAAQTLLGLTDTPASYSGQAGKTVKVNSGETAIEFASEVVWVPISFDAAPASGALLVKFVAPGAVAFADDFAGSYGHVGTNPGASFVVDVQLNGSSIGSITVSTGGTFTFATTGGAVAMVAGDRLEVFAPSASPAEATIARLGCTLAGTR